MTFHIITLFPHAFDSYLGESILKRAIEDKKIKVKFYNPRDFTRDKHKRVDRAPYGGGPGMVIQAEPVIRAIEKAIQSSLRKQGSRKTRLDSRFRGNDKSAKVVWLSPNGKQFTNETGITLAKYSDLIIICGRYEGIDARVKQAIRAMHPSSASSPLKRGGKRWGALPRIEEISVGPYVLTGGELPAMLMIDVISRQVEGVLGDPGSREETRIASPDVYTRPEVFAWRGRKYKVPKILLSGHHAKIDEWRHKRKK